ncbi:MAG: HRDC domain-containing protein, partial [Treponema sp.]|nr:HRDC domain-containing protein [Treponema sp.]
VLNYHAGLSDIERKENQSKFIRDEVQIMIATLAFGMGINKPNVRFVIHNDIPKSIEQYYQEIGRAGRDGLASEALLLYSASDIVKIRYFFDESADRKRAEKLLQGIIYFASSKSCRRKTLLTYFGEDFKSLGESKKVSDKNIPTNKNITGIEDDFPCCDICQNSDIPLSDVTLPFQKLLSCIIRTGQKFGSSYVIDVLLGSKQKRILENEHDKLSTYGIGKNIPKEMWFQITESLVYENYILKTDDYSVLKITEKGMNALRNRNTIFLPLREIEYYVAEKHSRSKYERNKNRESFFKNILFAEDENKNSENEDLILLLKKWRIDEAKNQNVPPYIIFGDKTLHELVHYLPKSKSELKMIYGLGDAKVERYGEEILRIIKNY